MFGQSRTNKHMGRTNILWDEQTYYRMNKHRHKKVEMLNFFCLCSDLNPNGLKKHPQWHGGSKYVLSFEIGQWEGGFYSERTNTHTYTHFGKL